MLANAIPACSVRFCTCLNVPLAVSELVESQTLRHLLHFHCVGQILLVCEHQQHCIAQLVLAEHAVELLLGRVLVVLGIVDTVAIVRVHHEDDALRVLRTATAQTEGKHSQQGAQRHESTRNTSATGRRSVLFHLPDNSGATGGGSYPDRRRPRR